MPSNANDAFKPITIPIPARYRENGNLELVIQSNDRCFVVGPNGSGKSALIHHFMKHIPKERVYRISAHRQTWFNSGQIEVTPSSRRQFSQDLDREERQATGRWRDAYASRRLGALLFDLIALENQRARDIARAVDQEDVQKASSTAKGLKSPFECINEILRAGNLSVQIEASIGEEILARHVDGHPFSVAKLSDGERNAVILAAAALTVESGTVLLIDEPERHLHRSIIEPLLTALFASRSDCPFIISTHELALPVAARDAKVLLPRSCKWNGDTVEAWDIDILEPGTDLPEDLKAAVLGSRKQILFVEGNFESLDVPLYGLLLPNSTVIPKGTCTEVVRAVKGLRSAEKLHWIQAYGLVDRDDRSDEQVEELQEVGVFALPVHSAEAIYYSHAAVRRLAVRQAETLGENCEEFWSTATTAALKFLSDEETTRRLCARRCERLSRDSVLSQMPTWRDIADGKEVSVNVSMKKQFDQETEKYNKMLGLRDLQGLISRYPVRESPALSEIAAKLQFNGRSKYEQAVLALACNNESFRQDLRSLLGPIAAQINPDEAPKAEQPEA